MSTTTKKFAKPLTIDFESMTAAQLQGCLNRLAGYPENVDSIAYIQGLIDARTTGTEESVQRVNAEGTVKAPESPASALPEPTEVVAYGLAAFYAHKLRVTRPDVAAMQRAAAAALLGTMSDRTAVLSLRYAADLISQNPSV
jgi:hypothetical protein